MKFIDSNKIKFNKHENELLSCTYDGKTYESVKIIRCFPLTSPYAYLSICYEEDNETKELGIIEKIDDLSLQDKSFILQDLTLRYFIPQILKIEKRISKQYHDFICITDAGKKDVRVKELIYSLFPTPNGDLLIKDCDENYYLIKDYMHSKDKHIKYIRSFI